MLTLTVPKLSVTVERLSIGTVPVSDTDALTAGAATLMFNEAVIVPVVVGVNVTLIVHVALGDRGTLLEQVLPGRPTIDGTRRRP